MQVGTFRIVIEARDASPGNLAARDVGTFELVVKDSASGDFIIATEALEDGVLGEGYDATITAMGGLQPYQWTLVEGRLPDGLLVSVDPTTGEFRIAGAPTEAILSNLLVSVVDAQGRVAQKVLVLRVLETAPIDPMADQMMDDDGCGCTSSERRSPGASLMLLGLLGLALLRRRR